MDNFELKQLKKQCLEDLRAYLPGVKSLLDDIDERLYAYASDAVREDIDTANIYELLGIRKVLRLMNTYPGNEYRVMCWLRAIEGYWSEGKHRGGGLMFDTPRGPMHVRLMPYQVWCVYGMMAFDVIAMMKPYAHGMELLPTEFIENGMVYDRRRLCTEAHIFQTRKSGKTEFGGALDYVEANVLGPKNSQVLVCANSKEQAKIAFKAIKSFCYQTDPDCVSKAGGKYFRVTADEMSWLPGNTQRTSEIKVMSAGGKTKDGLYASWVHADEHGSASYTNGHSDMQDLVEVCAGSMGPRREHMLIHTTTAGLVNEGPYQLQLRQVEQQLLKEMDYPLGEARDTDTDHWFALLLRLDPWDFNGDIAALDHENLFRKVNRSIGTTVQPTWYKARIKDAINGTDDTRREVLTKDFNLWQTNAQVDWIRGEQIRMLQQPRTIDSCISDDGWLCFCGLDFSMGDDLHAASYLAVRPSEDGGMEFFADMDAWISEEALADSPLRSLFELWIQKGKLHVSPGATLDPTLPVKRIAELYDNGVVFGGFGYDSYKAKTPINALSAWVAEITGDAKAPKDYIVPVSQTYASYNPVVEEMDYMVKADPPLIHFSDNPMWPWEFNNCVLDMDVRYENKKPVKRSQADKVDNVQALLSALMMYDLADGSVK